MTEIIPTDEVLEALKGLMSGTKSSTDFEAAMGTAVRSGAMPPSVAADLVQDAITAGLVESGTLLRLGLHTPAVETRLRTVRGGAAASPASSADSSHGRSREQLAARTRIRSLIDAAPPPIESDSTIAPLPRDDSAAPSARAGQLLSGRYLLERELGAGGMGVVYLARDQQIKGETFAVKVLRPEIRALSDSLEIMREEVRKTRALAHPNIVGMYSLNLDGDAAYILMEFLEGKGLESLIDEDFSRGMPFARAYPIILDICAALAHAHDHGVIHSDLKPSNVFVVNSGKAKLLDFGIARSVRNRAGRYDTAELGGLTVAYASCEMLNGLAADPRDDIYSLGVVIYHMLTGRGPFDRSSALEAQSSNCKYKQIKSLTSKQNSALAESLAFARTDRTGSVEALLNGLAPARDGTAWLLTGSIAVVVALSAVIGWLVFLRPAHPEPPAGVKDSHTTVQTPQNSSASVALEQPASHPEPALGPPSQPAEPMNACHQVLSADTLERALTDGLDASARAALYPAGSSEARDASEQKRVAIECLKALREAGFTTVDSKRFLDEASPKP